MGGPAQVFTRYHEKDITRIRSHVYGTTSKAYESGRSGRQKNWLVTNKPSERTPGLFKLEFVDTMGVWLTAKCYLVQNEAEKINIAVKVFQKSIMICIFSTIKMSWIFF